MPSKAPQFVAITSKIRALTVAILSVTLIAVTTAIPASQASVAKPTVTIPTKNLSSIFASLPVSDLGSSAQLEALLPKVQSLKELGLSEKALREQVQTVLGSLGPNATVEELVNGLLGNTVISNLLNLLHLSVSSEQVLQALEPGQLEVLASKLDDEQLSKLLSSLAGQLDPEQLGSLQSVLQTLAARIPAGELEKLEQDLQTLLGTLSKGELQQTLEALLGKLGGSAPPQLQELLSQLGSLSPSQLQAKLQTLLQGLDSEQLAALLDTLAGQLKSTQLERVIGDLVDGLPLSMTNAGALAGELGMEVGKVGEELGSNVTSTTPVLSAVLGKEGPVLGMIGEASGLKLGVLGGENASKAGNGGNGGSGNGANGGSGANGGASGQSTIVVVINPNNGATTAKSASKARIKIISHKVKGHQATFVIQVPGAGNITLSGAHVTKTTRKVTKPGRLTLKVRLTRAGLASLHRHRGLLRVNITAHFRPRSGASSSATASVRFL